jgi:hypothetical protein
VSSPISLITFRVSLEAGGNAPFIVFDDANIDEAVAGMRFPLQNIYLSFTCHTYKVLSCASSGDQVKLAFVQIDFSSSLVYTPNSHLVSPRRWQHLKSETDLILRRAYHYYSYSFGY